MFDLNYQQSHRRLGVGAAWGPSPEQSVCVCVWNTNRGFTSDQRVSSGRGPLAPEGLGYIPAAAFLICWTWVNPPPPSPPRPTPSRGANWTRLFAGAGRRVVMLLSGVGGVSRRVPDGLTGEFSIIRITIQQCRFRLRGY